MILTRRRTGLGLVALVAAGSWPGAGALARAKAPPSEDDDDDDTNLPNVFISPCGQPFRAAAGAPYPVVDWFNGADKNGDGKLDRAEFVADADAFFNILDINKDGYLSHYEIQIYEHRIAPEILVGTAHIGLGPRLEDRRRGGAKLWLAQVDQPGPIDPSGDDQSIPQGRPPPLDESGQGASPYSFFPEPEPVMTADLNVNGIISKANFLKTADMHFDDLDQKQRGYLTLATLPKTPIEKAIERANKGRKKRS